MATEAECKIDHKEMEAKVDDKLSLRIFIWAMTFILVVLGIVSTYAMGASNKVDQARDDISEVKGDIKSIKTSLEFIQASIVNLKK